jgi:type I restriction-modification system DNA methylase subunit
VTCFDDENFPVVLIETKWRVEPSPQTKEKQRNRIEELGSVKYGVFASERDFIVYEYVNYKLEDVVKINVAEAVGFARGEYGLSDIAKRRIVKLETLKRDCLVWIEEDLGYFKETCREISLAKGDGVDLLIKNLKNIARELADALVDFFDSYWKREDYSGRFLRKHFNDWLKNSMKQKGFEEGNEEERQKVVEVFCRETAYVLVGRVLFTRICEDKEIISPTNLSGEGLIESLQFYERKMRKNQFLLVFNESREEIKKYYCHLYELGFFDWWWISPEKRELLNSTHEAEQDRLEDELNHQIRKCLRRLNRFDFAQVNRDILGDVYQGYLPPDERKQLGEFYTPKEVIEYILDFTGYTPENEIRAKRILDPSCGSGGFLVESIRRLIERYRRVGFNLKNPDDSKQIIEGCINSIYGLDIHPFACFIAEINLLFQLVDLYDIVRQKDRSYELPRIRVYRTDSLLPLGETTELTEFLDNSRRTTLIEETKGADATKTTKFHFVIGNPPYVRIQRILEAIKQSYKKQYLSSTGKFDLYVLFIERGIKWLEENGKLGFIVSNKFTQADYGSGIRKFILEHCMIEQLVDFGDSGVFADATNYPCILILNFGKSGQDVFKFVRVNNPKENMIKHIKTHINDERFLDGCIQVFNVPQSSLGEDFWKFIPERELKVFDRLKKTADHSLKDLCEKIGEGIVTGKNEAFVVQRELLTEYQLEKDLVKPILGGENVRRWAINWNNRYLIYPHRKQGNKMVAIDLSNYSHTRRYLEKHKEELQSRLYVLRAGKKWYELWNPRDIDLFETSPKIVTPDVSTKNNFAVDERSYYCLDTCFIIIPKTGFDVKLLLGLLNSKVVEFYFKEISPYVSGGYYRYKTQYLEQLPIRLPKSDEMNGNSRGIGNLVSHIVQLHEENSAIKERIERFPDSYFEDDWDFDMLSNIIKGQNLSSDSFGISEKSPRTYYKQRDLMNGSETFKLIFGADEFIDFDSEEIASYVLELLKKVDRITKRELFDFKIPRQSHLRHLLGQYRKDKEQITKNKKMIEELEKQIDDLVYRLYEIDYAERRIIENYLKEF